MHTMRSTTPTQAAVGRSQDHARVRGVSIQSQGDWRSVHPSSLGEQLMTTAASSRNVLVAAFVLSGACPIASAADFYAGGSVGQTKAEDYEDYVASNYDDGSIVAADFDDKDTALRLFVGADVNPNVAVELGYVDLGEATTDALSNGCCFYAAGGVRHELSADGIDLSVLGKLPVGDAGAVNVRIGFLKWDGDEKISDSTGSLSGSDDGTDFFLAFGGQYRLSEQFGLRGEYAMYKLDDFDVDVLSLSLIFQLGQT